MNPLNQTFEFSLIAQQDGGGGGGGGGGVIGLIIMLVYLALVIAVIVGFWKVFVKAGKPGWGSIIPIYNGILLLEIAGRPI